MQATPQQIRALEALQEIDRARMQAQHELETLPHRDQVLEGRAKRKEVQAKLDQVSQMLVEEKSSLQQLKDEDERLRSRQDETQAKIEQSQDDYRQVTSLTRDLEGMAKRRETLEFQMGKIEDRIAEVAKVHEKASQAIAALDKRESELVEDHKQRSAHLAALVQQAAAKRQDLASALPEDIIKVYSTALEKCNGVGLARLAAGKCGACRSPIDADRMLQVRQDAPLATCPSCKRILIVEDDAE